MSKPDWSTAPSWARYVVCDADGRWWWHEERPDVHGAEWLSTGDVDMVDYFIDWDKSLESRP